MKHLANSELIRQSKYIKADNLEINETLPENSVFLAKANGKIRGIQVTIKQPNIK
ncbi:hypothetical protein TMUPMC115_1958 [Tetragenococcus muriaticus PMC-11-5]|uniref:Uncharacterized protein n=1 Tax=Tetragenococcus muriaticus PMC-11-5 TaxID=1302649 RepID=A0A091CCI0_9ENTE|nr:hypothetical protein TMUPMC115_1958 [Tetragenococcus muriaticus PMC-11-5]